MHVAIGAYRTTFAHACMYSRLHARAVQCSGAPHLLFMTVMYIILIMIAILPLMYDQLSTVLTSSNQIL